MKNNLLIIVVVLLVVIGGIILFYFKPNNSQETMGSNSLMLESVPTTVGNILTTENSPAMPSNQLSLQGSYKCTYKIEGELQVTTYVKNGKMRTEIPLESDNITVALYTEDKVYQWNEKEKQGMVINVTEAQQQPGLDIQDPEAYLTDIKNKYQADCQNMDLADSLFVIPKDIQFQDISEALRQ